MLQALSLDPVGRPEGLAGEIVASMREPFAVLDSRLRLLDASPAFFLRFGLRAEECRGRVIYELGKGEWDTPGSRELFELLAPSREVVEGYSLEVRFAGAERPRVSASLRPIRSGRNQIRFFLLGFSESSSASAIAHPPLISLRDDSSEVLAVIEQKSLQFRYLDGPVLEVTGYTSGELRGIQVEQLLHPVEREGVVVAMSRLRPNEPPLRSTFRVRNVDGRYLWIESSCRAVQDGGDTLIQLLFRDVSERRRAEEALRWLGRQTKLILDSAADGIFGVDSSGNITFINPAAARLLGYRHQELLGRSYRVLLTSADPQSEADDPVAATLEDALTRVISDGSLKSSDGHPLNVELSCSPAREHGAVTGAVVTLRDVTQRRRAEAAALRSKWLAGVGETTIALRHEINNPLTTLLAEAKLLEMGGNSRADELEMIASICAEARRIGDVMRRLAERQDDPPIRMDGNQRMLDLTPP